jgi:hypothetical protein
MRALDLFKGWHFDQEIICDSFSIVFASHYSGILVQDDRAKTRKPNIVVIVADDVMIRGPGHIKAGAREKSVGLRMGLKFASRVFGGLPNLIPH